MNDMYLSNNQSENNDISKFVTSLIGFFFFINFARVCQSGFLLHSLNIPYQTASFPWVKGYFVLCNLQKLCNRGNSWAGNVSLSR